MTILTIVLLGCSAIVWGLAVFVVPQHVNSLFRYRLWRLRDDLEDHILDGRLPECPGVRDLLETLEAMIEHPEELTLSSIFAHRIFRKELRAAARDSVPDLSDLSAEQKSLYADVLHESYESVLFKAIAASPAGAVTFPLWLLWFSCFRPRSSAASQRELRRFREFHMTLEKHDRSSKDLVASVG